MRIKYIIVFSLSLILFYSCSKEKQKEEKRRIEAHKKDSTSTSKYYEGLEFFKKQEYISAKYDFEDVDSLNRYFKKSQNYLRIINDTIKVYEKNTFLLISMIDSFLVHYKHIDDNLLFDSLVSKEIINSEYIKDTYRDEIEESYREGLYYPEDNY